MVFNHTTEYGCDMFLAVVYMVPFFKVLFCDSWHLTSALFFSWQQNMIRLLEMFLDPLIMKKNWIKQLKLNQ